MGFSAMLAEEYKLIDISIITCSSGWTNLPVGRQAQQRFRLTNHGISAQLKALTDGRNNMEPEIYKVVIDNIERNVLSLIPHDEVFKNGLPNKGIIGYVTNPLNSLSPDNVYLNPNFIKLFHKIIRETSLTEESFKLSAQRQKQGYVYIIDQRDKHYPNTKSCDIIGAFQVVDGEVIVDSYQPNPNYQIISEGGLFQSALHFSV